MSVYTNTATQEQDDALAHALTKPEVLADLAANGYALTAAGYLQCLQDRMLRPVVAVMIHERNAMLLAKLAANPDVLAQVDALATPVAKP